MDKKEKVNFFKKYVNKYIDLFSLHDWELYIEEQDKPACRGSCYYGNLNDIYGQIATICYSKNWIESIITTKEEIEKVAFHEVMELLLSILVEMAKNNIILVTEREIMQQYHRIIRTFENKILPLIKEK